MVNQDLIGGQQFRVSAKGLRFKVFNLIGIMCGESRSFWGQPFRVSDNGLGFRVS